MATPTSFESREALELELLRCDLEDRRYALVERRQATKRRTENHKKALVAQRVELWLLVFVTITSTAASLIYVINGGAWPALAAPVVPGLLPLVRHYALRPRRSNPDLPEIF